MCVRVIETIVITSVFDAFSAAILACSKTIASNKLLSRHLYLQKKSQDNILSHLS